MAYSRFRQQHPDFQPHGPAFNDEDGVPLYEAPYQDLLAEIVRRNDVASLLLYNDSPNTTVFWKAYQTYYCHPLINATESGSFNVLKTLLKIYLADSTLTEPINAYLERVHSSPINDACAAADRELMLWLLHQDPPLGTLHDRSVDGETPLFSAARALGTNDIDVAGTIASRHQKRDQSVRSEDFICFLLDKGCSVPNSDFYVHYHGTKKPSHLDLPRAELSDTVLGAAIPHASYQMVSRLIAEGANIYARQKWHNNNGVRFSGDQVTVVHIAAHFWNLEAMKALADNFGQAGLAAMSSMTDDAGRLPLHWALNGYWDNRTEMDDWDDQEEITDHIIRTIEMLLEGNPDALSIRDQEGANAFHYAVTCNSSLAGILPVVKMLLGTKPPPLILSARNHLGWTVLETAIDSYGRVRRGNPSVQFLDMLIALLEHGADGRTCNAQSQNLLHKVAMCFRDTGCADIPIIEKLLEYVNVNDADVDGHTPLHFMVRHLSRVNAVQHLIVRGANVNVVDNKGNSPLHEAMRGQLVSSLPSDQSKTSREKMIKVLVDAGASMYQSNAAGQTPPQLLHELTEMERRRAQNFGGRRGRGRGG
ncbi:hypothetical protein PENANT_c001G09219 [Penicillium antarcticum]|uniref:Uncharacterized protein n=1 Tax=Penicillium antarcticum TaxID=416450 RepID=A0A1V6QP72_9EURO|nr:uncharacterized protein N7508_010498 [Penicillium antarcticum]KAJ5295677.1 hypothetical protein N7508_010498 [Penicillium antarcticum]OQD90961.1 hypothetical protein PENANT_c001G09219 [Penicillium antarcticum]